MSDFTMPLSIAYLAITGPAMAVAVVIRSAVIAIVPRNQ